MLAFAASALAVAVFLSLLPAGTARAATIEGSGIQDYWGNPGTAAGAAGGQFGINPGLRGVAVNDATGDVFVADTFNNRIQQFSGDGEFVRAWGWDVIVNTGTPPNSNGTGFEVCDTTTDPPNTPAQCKAGVANPAGGALNRPAGLAIDQGDGNLYVLETGNSASTGKRAQEFRFEGAGGAPVFVRSWGRDVIVNTGTPPNSNGTGFEVCDTTTDPPNTPAQCKVGLASPEEGGTLNLPRPNQITLHADLAVAPQGAPNAGNVLVTDPLANRVQEFTTDGAFVRAYGHDVDTSDPSDGFEVCTVAADCKPGSPGAAAGQFGSDTVRSVAEDASGNVYTVETTRAKPPGAANLRVQRFSVDGPGAPEVSVHGEFACALLCGSISNPGSAKDTPDAVAVDEDGDVYVTKAVPLGQGDPPAGSFANEMWQHRVLKIAPDPGDPDEGHVVDTFLANPGRFNRDNPTQIKSVHSGLGLTGLAVGATGLPLYVVNDPEGASSTQTRVYRVDAIGGVTASPSLIDSGATTATLGAAITPADTRLDTFYRFEYSRAGFDEWEAFKAPRLDDAEAQGVNIGNGSDGGESSDCAPNEGSRAAVCHVTQIIEALEPGLVYEFRVVVTSEARGVVLTSDPVQFETVASAPTATTGPAVWSGPPASGPSDDAPVLTFNGQVNPQGLPTAFQFEYGTQGPCSANPCAQVPTVPRNAGRGLIALDVNATVASVDSGVAYHYRLIASNSEGTSFGADRAVAPPSPGDRFIELVSAGDSQGMGIFEDLRLLVSDDGERAMFSAISFNDQPSSPSIGNPNVAVRDPSRGWQVRSMSPSPANPVAFRGRDETAVDAELTEVAWLERPTPGTVQWAARGIDGGYGPISEPLSPLQRVGDEADRLMVRGASADQSTLVFANHYSSSGRSFLADEPLVLGNGPRRLSNLYALRDAGGDSPALTVVNRDRDGQIVGGACGARLGAEATGLTGGPEGQGLESMRAVSADGSAIYFSARPGNPATCTSAFGGDESTNAVRIFKRIGDSATVHVSEPHCDTDPLPCSGLGSGSLEAGSKVVTNLSVTRGHFVAGQPIAAVAVVDLTKIPAGTTIEQVLSPTSLELSAPATQTAANVQLKSNDGDDFYHGASADGTRVYFTSPRRLTVSDGDISGGCSTIVGLSIGCDLYLYDSTEPAGQEVTQVSAGEVVAGDHPTVGSGANVLGVVDVSMDGSRVYFVAQGRLTPEGTAGTPNLYVFERVPGGQDRIDFVARLSPRLPTEQNDPVDQELWLRGAGTKEAYAAPLYEGSGSARADGSGHLFFFTSEEPLDPGEDQDSSPDLYRFDHGEDELSCLSCVKDLAFPVSIFGRATRNSAAAFVQQYRVTSDDGSAIVFTTSERLLAEDSNNAIDVYLWREGEGLSLVTAATGGAGVAGSFGRAESDLGGIISADGQSVFFATRATILPEDTNNGGMDWYVARVGGGFPREPSVSDPCRDAGALCQGEDPQPRSPAAPLASTQFSGQGNVTETSRRTCGRAKLRRGNRCVSKRVLAKRACAKRKGKAKRRCVNAQMRRLTKVQRRQNRANNNRRAGR